MKFSANNLVLAAILSVVPCIQAAFPGSTFGITYTTTSTLIPASGHLTVYSSEGTSPSSQALLTVIGDGPHDLGGFLTYSGTGADGGYLHNACSEAGLAALLVPEVPVPGLKYVLGWTAAPLSELPEGSVGSGFQLGPAPTYDTVIQSNPALATGSWAVGRVGETGPLIVGWSDESTGSGVGIPITLVKAGVANISC
ncbi:hypothetical protein B0H34DRAFT_798354 [Crassisporium funariophilum]|nr:hypothetical protein B0H34DRAFT_798354 [Crassisporium funariophilum]